MEYIHKIRVTDWLHVLPTKLSVLLKKTSDYFLATVNTKLASLSLPWIKPLMRLQRLCPVRTVNSVSHLALYCPSLEQVRHNVTGLFSFCNMCHSKQFSENYTFELFVNGLDWNKRPSSSTGQFLQRGMDLKLLMDNSFIVVRVVFI